MARKVARRLALPCIEVDVLDRHAKLVPMDETAQHSEFVSMVEGEMAELIEKYRDCIPVVLGVPASTGDDLFAELFVSRRGCVSISEGDLLRAACGDTKVE